MRGENRYNVGLGPYHFYLLVPERKTPIAKILSADTESKTEVDKWAHDEYIKWAYRTKKSHLLTKEEIKWVEGLPPSSLHYNV